MSFLSTNNPFMSFEKPCYVKSLLGILVLTYINMVPPFRFRSSRKGQDKPSITKPDVVNVSSD